MIKFLSQQFDLYEKLKRIPDRSIPIQALQRKEHVYDQNSKQNNTLTQGKWLTKDQSVKLYKTCKSLT